MEEKKYIKISLGTAICIIIIFILIIVLVCLGFYTYKIKNDINNTNTIVQEDTLDSSENVSTNTSDLSNTNTTENIGTEVNINDSIVKVLIEKIDFPTYATASIYNEGEFNLDTISNDLILRLGWSKLNDDDKETFLNNDEEMYKDRVTKEILNSSILDIFGPNVKYTDKSFTNIDVPTFYGYEQNQGEINYSNNVYTADSIDGGGGDVPFIHQEVKKVLKYNDKIEVYVNTVFIDTQYIDDDNGGDFEYIIYKNYNNNKFEEKLTETTSEEFSKNYSNDEYNGNISLKSNSEIAKIANQLNTYVYSFELDNIRGEYYLSEFNISK